MYLDPVPRLAPQSPKCIVLETLSIHQFKLLRALQLSSEKEIRHVGQQLRSRRSHIILA